MGPKSIIITGHSDAQPILESRNVSVPLIQKPAFHIVKVTRASLYNLLKNARIRTPGICHHSSFPFFLAADDSLACLVRQ